MKTFETKQEDDKIECPDCGCKFDHVDESEDQEAKPADEREEALGEILEDLGDTEAPIKKKKKIEEEV